MLKTLIVDDEKLVRGELKHIVDWEKFGIEIVGEAENGRRALAFLETHDVGLIITDLSMPGLSGMEFIGEVRRRYPLIRIVVMTMYQDFDFVRQAMRLGVVDYITKTRIEKDNIEEILTNILKRLRHLPGETLCETDTARVALTVEERPPIAGALQLDEGFWLLPSGEEALPEGIELRVQGAYGQPYLRVLNRARSLSSGRLFFEYEPDTRIYAFPMEAEADAPPLQKERASRILCETSWITDDALYADLTAQLPSLGFNRDEMTALLYQPYLVCARCVGLSPGDYFTLTRGFQWWFEWRKWLSDLRSRTARALGADYSENNVIRSALRYIDENYMKNLSVDDMLRLTAMSKTRFSTLFKETTGKTFVNYLTDARMERAREMLAETSFSVERIGERVGYPDERYFRRAFEKSTGRTPAKYRAEARANAVSGSLYDKLNK